MGARNLIAYFFIASAVISCTKKNPLQEGRWSGEGQKPSLSAEGLTSSQSGTLGDETIQFSDQKIERFPVEKAFVKTISKDNTAIFQSFAVLNSVPASVLADARTMDTDKENQWIQFLNKNSKYQSWKIEESSKVIIATSRKIPMAVYSALLRNKRGEIYELQFLKDSSVFKSSRVGSNIADLFDVPALAFPKGPKKSDLSKVTVSKYNLVEGLANNRIELKTESPFKISANQDLESLPADERFDQIQAYYFANQIISWFEKKLVLKTPLAVGLLTHVGYPERTNTAFYFKGQVRLGTGDDISFSKILWDPSIVMHEVSHAVIDYLARLPFQGEGGSINEGFADVFTTFFLDSPLLGDNAYKAGPYKRSVEPTVKLNEKNGGLYHDSAIVSSFFWKLKNTWDADKALQLAFRTLIHLSSNTTFDDFVLSLKEQTAQLYTGADLSKVQSVMSEWGFL